MAEEGTQDQGSTGDTGQGGGEAKWYDSLPDDLKGNDTLKGFDGIESLAKAHLTATEEAAALKAQIEASKPVIPEAPEGYELPVKADGMPDEITADLSSQISRIAHQAGLSKEQAAKAFEAAIADEKRILAEGAENFKKAQEATVEALKKDYGEKWAEKVDNGKLRFAQVAGKAGIEAEAATAFLNETGIGDNPTFIKFAIALADLISPDNFERNAAGGGEGKSAAQTIYNNPTSNHQ